LTFKNLSANIIENGYGCLELVGYLKSFIDTIVSIFRYHSDWWQ